MPTPFQSGSSSSSRPFEAKFPGMCETCGGGFEKGDMMMFEGGDLVHADPDECVPLLLDRDSYKTPCPKCFLVHAGECF